MKGFLFEDFEVELDPRVKLEKGSCGSWGQGPGGQIWAGDWDLVRLFFEAAQKYDNPVVLDIGAATGSFSLLPLFHPAEIWAFEPHPQLYSILQSNVRLNKLEHCVHISQHAISNKVGTATLYTASIPHRFGFSNLGRPLPEYMGKRIDFPVVTATIDSLKLDRVDMIKIDTEGCERFVLEGGEETIRRCHPEILMEYTNIRTRYFGYEPSELTDLLKQWGYKHFHHVGNEDLWATVSA